MLRLQYEHQTDTVRCYARPECPARMIVLSGESSHPSGLAIHTSTTDYTNYSHVKTSSDDHELRVYKDSHSSQL